MGHVGKGAVRRSLRRAPNPVATLHDVLVVSTVRDRSSYPLDDVTGEVVDSVLGDASGSASTRVGLIEPSDLGLTLW